MSEKETPEVPTYPTAFLMIKEGDGAWRVSTDLKAPFNVEGQATRLDIRIGCQEIANVVAQQDLAAVVVNTLISLNSSEDAPQTDAE